MPEYQPTPPSERGDPVGGAPAQERSLRAQGKKTVNKLLDAGIEVFGKRGFHATRVDDIVKAAKTSHGTFYLYFSNKEDLLGSLIAHCSEEMDALLETLGDVTPDAAGRAELREWLSRFAVLYEHYGPVIRAWAEVAETVNPEFAQRGAEMLGN
ncbi:MAG: TetR/AcrR family transcriptional regulator, partial [Nitriliruptorales bacterium]|nr:TetR/AcrR family transcriptional regulator [Nitriliruptorales bacterium]